MKRSKQSFINTGLAVYDQIRRFVKVPVPGTKLKLELPYIDSGDPEFEEARRQVEIYTTFSPSSWASP